MFLAFCIRNALIVSVLIFVLSSFQLIWNVANRHARTEPVHVNPRNQPNQSSVGVLPAGGANDLHFELSAEREHEQLVREKILGANRTFRSVFDRFTFINPPRPVCIYPEDSSNFLIILVLSRGLNFDYRQVIRATWGTNGKQKTSKIVVQTLFFVGTDDSVDLAIRNEQQMFNDVIEIGKLVRPLDSSFLELSHSSSRLGIPEKYPFVAHKELASLFWTRLYCPSARMIFRADDDILLNIFLFLRHLETRINLDTHDGLHGWFRFNNTLHRADKWAVTKREYPSKIYPPYTFGIGYLFSNVSCQGLVEAANQPHHQVIRIGDAYITGILRELAGLSFYDFDNLEYGYTFNEALPCDEMFEKKPHLLICMSKLHIGVRNDPYEFYDVWDVITMRQNKTASPAVAVEADFYA